MEKEEKEYQLCEACRYGRLNNVKRLVNEGVDVNSTDDGTTPLMYAVRYGHVDIVRLLLDRGANINNRDYTRRTALYHAAWHGHDEIVRLLIERGAHLLHMKDYFHHTPLDRAKQNNDYSIVAIIEAAITSIKVIYTSSQSLQQKRVTFKDFNNNIIIVSDNNIPNGFEFQGKPVFTLQHIQQCIDHLPNTSTDNEDNIQADNLHDIILAQRHPVIAQRLQYWGMNLLHLIPYFPQVLVTANDTNDAILSLLTKCPKATTSIDIDGMTPLHHAAINVPKKKISQECHDLLLTRSPSIVVHRAIEAGLNWEYLRPIVMAKVNALTMEDEDSGLVPFMLAAKKCNDDNEDDDEDDDEDDNDDDDEDGRLSSLSMAYELLCLKPDVMKEYDEFNQGKRTLDSSTGPSNGSTKRSRAL